MPLLIGNGTKISKYLIEHDKTYVATLQLGEKTSTGDVEGEVIETKKIEEASLKEDYINKVLNNFLGKQVQIPPIYSAIKVNGKKLYEYARSNKTVEIPKRTIEIYSIKLIKIEKEMNQIIFEVECSKGTYIRTLCEDIAEKMNTVGYMKELNRIKVGRFSIEQSITIDELEINKDNNNYINKNIISIEELFCNSQSIELNEENFEHFLNGVKVSCNLQNGVVKVYNNKNFIGLGIVEDNKLKRDVV